ncbi:MAG: hypothetical protein GDA44_05400 [Prochloron sp. SP5CPC1]|nr:hypothetical protein [Candidatus Paraprochloron terpiosi SP5CPC1]
MESKKKSKEELYLEIENLAGEIQSLKEEKRKLKNLLETTTEQADRMVK